MYCTGGQYFQTRVSTLYANMRMRSVLELHALRLYIYLFISPSINVLLHLVLQGHNIIFSPSCADFFFQTSCTFFDDALGLKLHLAHSVMVGIREGSTCAFFLCAREDERRGEGEAEMEGAREGWKDNPVRCSAVERVREKVRERERESERLWH